MAIRCSDITFFLTVPLESSYLRMCWTDLHQFFRIGTHGWAWSNWPSILHSLQSHCYGNRFWCKRAKIGMPHLHSMLWLITMDGRITTWMRALTPPMGKPWSNNPCVLQAHLYQAGYMLGFATRFQLINVCQPGYGYVCCVWNSDRGSRNCYIWSWLYECLASSSAIWTSWHIGPQSRPSVLSASLQCALASRCQLHSSLLYLQFLFEQFAFCALTTRQCRRGHVERFGLSHLSVRWPICPILLPRYLVNGLNNFDKMYREYSLASTEDLIRFWPKLAPCGSRGCK